MLYYALKSSSQQSVLKNEIGKELNVPLAQLNDYVADVYSGEKIGHIGKYKHKIDKLKTGLDL